ncbi:MAG: poly(3-hydroxybutyrate) depolymerase [Candidatus Altiarchaeales archaeon ex4484_96]|nr:MAG: poly(3-hydroxybutyrate) depolymerase [Candidatus Altiarchaeales archaeon ex4484_96]
MQDNTTINPQMIMLKPGDYEYTIKQGNKERIYLLHVPSSYNGNPAKLVLAFHGGMGSAEVMAKNYDWIPKSEEEGFIVAFPNGASRLPSGKLATWNAGRCCGYADKSNSDDVGFVKLIIEDIKKKAQIDKIYATGMSNGGMLSHRLACEMSDVFTAIAAVAGTNNYDNCNPKNPISILHIHGLQDDHVLFYGGRGPAAIEDVNFTSVSDTISGWLARNSCSSDPTRVLDEENAYCDLYSGCDNNVQVKLCVALDGGHSWPGIKTSPNPLERSPPPQAFSATDIIWDFFSTK